jgi:hypothetical protein
MLSVFQSTLSSSSSSLVALPVFNSVIEHVVVADSD